MNALVEQCINHTCHMVRGLVMLMCVFWVYFDVLPVGRVVQRLLCLAKHSFPRSQAGFPGEGTVLQGAEEEDVANELDTLLHEICAWKGLVGHRLWERQAATLFRPGSTNSSFRLSAMFVEPKLDLERTHPFEKRLAGTNVFLQNKLLQGLDSLHGKLYNPVSVSFQLIDCALFLCFAWENLLL